MWRLFGIVSAVVLHLGFIFFGGLFFGRLKEDQPKLHQVDLLSADEVSDPEKPKEVTPTQATEELATEAEEAPDAAEIMRNLETAPVNAAPALEAASLSAIEAALNGQGGGAGDFAQALSFTSGGQINGIGKAGAVDQQLENAFSLAEIDQKPRVVFQAPPIYPAELRAKKVEGVVTLIFVVDAVGKVSDPRVEKSTNSAFDKPALDAVKQWKFEAAVKGGQSVACKMRAPIRFKPNE